MNLTCLGDGANIAFISLFFDLSGALVSREFYAENVFPFRLLSGALRCYSYLVGRIKINQSDIVLLPHYQEALCPSVLWDFSPRFQFLCRSPIMRDDFTLSLFILNLIDYDASVNAGSIVLPTLNQGKQGRKYLIEISQYPHTHTYPDVLLRTHVLSIFLFRFSSPQTPYALTSTSLIYLYHLFIFIAKLLNIVILYRYRAIIFVVIFLLFPPTPKKREG